MTENQDRPTTAERWLARAPVAIITLFAILAFYFYVSASRTHDLVRHTDQVLMRTIMSLNYLLDAESGQRGFLLTGDTLQLVAYRSGADSAMLSFNRLTELTSDNPKQQATVREIRPVFQHRLLRLDTIVTRRLAGDTAGERSMVNNKVGRSLMDSVRTSFRTIRREENRLLAVREAQQAAAAWRIKLVLAFGLLLSALISYLVTQRFYNRATRHWQITAELSSRIEMLKNQAEELEATNEALRERERRASAAMPRQS